MTESATGANRWKLISFLLAGVLIPIVAGLIPWGLDHWTPQNSLQYSVVGPLVAEKARAVSVTVSNVGSDSQHNVQVWLPLDRDPDYETVTNASGIPNVVKKEPITYLQSSTRPSKTVNGDGNTVLYYNILRPGESLTVTAFVVGGSPIALPFAFDNLRIVSDNTVATKLDDSHEFDFIFKLGTGLFVAFIVFFLLFGFYYEVLVPVEKKKADLKKQLDKLSGD